MLTLMFATPALASLFYWDGPGYGRDSFTGGDGVFGEDGKGVEMQGSAPLGQPGNGGNEMDYVPDSMVWAVFEVVSDVPVSYGDMKLKLYDAHLGEWLTAKVMLEDASYDGPGHRYYYNALIHDGGLGDLYPSDGIKYYFQEWDGFACLPASACTGGPYLHAPILGEADPVDPPADELSLLLSDYSETVYAGTSLGFTINLINDTVDDLAFDRVEMHITSVDVDVVRVLYDGGAAEIPLAAGAEASKRVTMGVPDWVPLGDYRIDVSVINDGLELATDGYDFLMDSL